MALHVAQSGKNKGKAVRCDAEYQCTLVEADGSPSPHFATQEEFAAHIAKEEAAKGNPLGSVSKGKKAKNAPKVEDHTTKFASDFTNMINDTPGDLLSRDLGNKTHERMASEISNNTGRRIYSEDVMAASRGMAASLRQEQGDGAVPSAESLSALYKGVEKGVQGDMYEEVEYLPGNWSAHVGEKVGDREEASKLLNLYGDEVPNGFKVIGEGNEQKAYLHEESNTVYKVSRWINEGNEETTLNAVASAESFPAAKGIRYANTTAYAFGGRCIVAQEYVDPGSAGELSKENLAWMSLAGHDDTNPDNYGMKNGEIVCFDTGGAVYDDMLDSWRPANLVEDTY